MDPSQISEADKKPFDIMPANNYCAFRSLAAGLFGIPMAFFFSFFMMSPDVPYGMPGAPSEDASLWVKNKFVLRKTFRQGWQSGKNFFWLGLMWSGSECVIEKYRGQSDIWNGVGAAALSGMVLSWRGGLMPMTLSTTGMVAFAFVMESLLGKGSHRPSSIMAGFHA